MFILKKGHQPGVYVPLRALFLVIHILITTYQKSFRLGPEVQCRVDFHSVTTDPRVHARGLG